MNDPVYTSLRTASRADIARDPDVEALAAALRDSLTGDVRFDDGSRAVYATDASNYRQVPLGVILPKNAEDVVQAVSIARRFDAPILMRGAGTSVAGQSCNAAVVIEMTRYMNRVLEIDPAERRARVEAGAFLDDLRNAARRRHELTFGPDPSTHTFCTLGGMIGNNACGVHSVSTGKTIDFVEELEVLTYDGLRMRVGPTSDAELERIVREGGRRGEIYSGLKRLRDQYGNHIRGAYPNIPRPISGYSLYPLLPENGFDVAKALVGTEGTCATILEATVRLVPHPRKSVLLVLGFRDIETAADHVPGVLEFSPLAVEGVDGLLIEYMNRKNLYPKHIQKLPGGGGWLFVELGGETTAEAEEKARLIMNTFDSNGRSSDMEIFIAENQQQAMWDVREAGLGATAFVPGRADAWEGWEDTAVHPDDLGSYIRDLKRLMEAYGYESPVYGHFGDGLVHMRLTFDLYTEDGVQKMRRFVDEAAELVVRYGGSLSGEHGDGQSRAELLGKMFGEEMMQAFREFKMIWDPENKMNPGKLVDPNRITENLRLGPDFRHPQVETYFKYPDDHGEFGRATMRCVGVGECRKTETGTMCPSFQVLREEKHTTRGRAHLLFEMLHGDTVQGGWQDEHVHEALNLCLSCKGCKTECPVNVDMATYKAEFLAHYYKRRIRPIAAYSMGLIYWWARMASFTPRIANIVTQSRASQDAFKAVAGVAPQREMPPFAEQTFKSWFRQQRELERRKYTNGRTNGSPEARVILFADTFLNFFEPEIGIAAVSVLKKAGFDVQVPMKSMCCGRPLYEFGMLKPARRLLRQILENMKSEIRAGIPFVVLEPSCAATFRDELYSFFPQDEDAKRLKKQTYTLTEFLEQEAPDFRYPELKRKAVVHGHCHQKSVLGMDAEQQVLAKLGLDSRILDSGCCGVAGAFGYEKDKYELSVQCGERVLLPSVREASDDTIIISNGFSCRSQIKHGTDRRALHMAEVIHGALEPGHNQAPGRAEDKADVMLRRSLQSTSGRFRKTAVYAGLGFLTLAAWAAFRYKPAGPE